MSGEVQVSLEVGADPAAVYALVSDVATLPRWAAETVACRWLDGAEGPAVGARFRGVNARGRLRWATTCTVTDAVPGRSFGWRVDALHSPIAIWRFDIERTTGGCRVTESWNDRRNVFFRWIVGPLGTGVVDRSEHNRRNMETTLRQLKDYAEAPAG
jgi:uncharacterized protein YndB with AHSA1/START domain